ncbi:MAG: TenA family protein [Leptolyngbyaceae cyanobacterium]
MNRSQRLWQANQDLAQASLQHPFVQGIYAGTLPPEKFAYYVGQDAFFLEAFARAYSIAAAKAPDWQGFNTFHALAGGVLQELKLHESYAQTWEVDHQTVQPGVATRRYTDFLLATAWSQEVGITAVAMAPCMRLYAYIGQSLAAQGMPTHRYADWVQTYSSDDFEPLARQLEAIVDQYSPDTALVQDTFRYAMLCERDFFEAAWEYVPESIPDSAART